MDVSAKEVIMGKIREMFRSSGNQRPLTEGKRRGNIKPNSEMPARRPIGGPPAPIPKSSRCPPIRAIECDWIEVYVPDPKGFHDGCNIEHHDKVSFWVDTNGNLVVYKSLLDNAITYREYRKYVTSAGTKCWS